MARRVKTGRRADLAERERAMAWVTIYRQAACHPEKRHCLNPDDEPEIRSYIDADDVQPLLALLENFAAHGTFAHIPSIDIDRLLLRDALEKMRKEGATYQESVEKLSAENPRFGTTRNLERIIRVPTKRGTN